MSEHKFNVSLNLKGNELREVKFQQLGAAPTGSVARFFYNAVTNAPEFHDGTQWVTMDARKATNIPLSALASDPLARSNHTGTQLASTISDFNTSVRNNRLDQMAAPTVDVSLNSRKIIDLAAPTVGTDAANKAYVDSASTTGNAATATKLQTARTISITGVMSASGQSFDGSANITLTTSIDDNALTIAKTNGLQAALNGKQDALGFSPVNKAGDSLTGFLTLHADPSANFHAATKQYVDNAVQAAAAGIDPKDAVKAATTGNITLSGTQTIDGIALVANDEVLVKSQTNAAENGIWVVKSGAWQRRVDAVQGKLTAGALVLVLQGTANIGTQWYLSTDDPITVGTTPLVWVQFNMPTTYSNGNGLNLVGNTFSVKPATGIVVSAAGVAVDTAVVARKHSEAIGNGSANSFTINHNLGTEDVAVTIRNTSTKEVEYANITVVNTNSLTVAFAGAAPGNGAYRVTVVG